MIQEESIGKATDITAEAVDAEFSALDFLIVLARRKRFILRFTIGAAILAVAIVLLLPNQYTAETVVLPPVQTSGMGASLMSQLTGGGALASLAGGRLGIKSPGDMYVSLFRSRTVEDAVIQRFGLMERYKKKRLTDTRNELENHALVVLGIRDGLIRISVQDRDPKAAAEIANGYVEEFRKLSANLAITEASQRRLFFQQQLVEAKGNLASAEEAMKRTEQSTGVLQIDSQSKSLIEAAAMLRAQVVAKQVQIQGMRSFATEDNPELVMARQQLGALQAQLGKLSGSDQEADGFLVPKGKIPDAGMEYIRKYRDVKYHETIYELIAKQFEMAKLDEARQGAVIQVADLAVVPDKKSSPHRSLIVVLVMFGAFAISVLSVIVSEGLAQMRQNPKQNDKVRALHKLLSAQWLG